MHNDVSKEYHSTLTTNAYAPQFVGYSTIVDYSGYQSTNVLLNKYIDEGSQFEQDGAPSKQYIWFILNIKDVEILDQNSNKLRQSNWGGIAFIRTKVGFLALQDASTQDYGFYRSADLLDTDGIDFKFKSI
jgi:hypothetical protein